MTMLTLVRKYVSIDFILLNTASITRQILGSGKA